MSNPNDLAGMARFGITSTDPGIGIIRHADAGYDEAAEAAQRFGIRGPMLES
jgi:urocanate hydratase